MAQGLNSVPRFHEACKPSQILSGISWQQESFACIPTSLRAEVLQVTATHRLVTAKSTLDALLYVGDLSEVIA